MKLWDLAEPRDLWGNWGLGGYTWGLGGTRGVWGPAVGFGAGRLDDLGGGGRAWGPRQCPLGSSPGTRLVSELTAFIRTRASDRERAGEAEDSEFVRFFPDFVWAVRDFTLELQADGRSITEDEYLERALALKQGELASEDAARTRRWRRGGNGAHGAPRFPRAGYGRQAVEYNTTRQCIRNYFPTRKCFVFPPPVGAEQQGRPEELPEAALQRSFLVQVERFCQHVLASSRPKQLQDGAELNGRSEWGRGGGGNEGLAAVVWPHRASLHRSPQRSARWCRATWRPSLAGACPAWRGRRRRWRRARTRWRWRRRWPSTAMACRGWCCRLSSTSCRRNTTGGCSRRWRSSTTAPSATATSSTSSS